MPRVLRAPAGERDRSQDVVHIRDDVTPPATLVMQQLKAAGIDQNVLNLCQQVVTQACGEVATISCPSRAAFMVGSGVSFEGAVVPPAKQWYLLLVPHHRTTQALNNALSLIRAFACMDLAMRKIRAESCDELFVGGCEALGLQMDMLKAIASWQKMTEERFQDILRLLMFTGRIRARGTLNNYQFAIGNATKSYHAAAGTGVDKDKISPFHMHGYIMKACRGFISSHLL